MLTINCLRLPLLSLLLACTISAPVAAESLVFNTGTRDPYTTDDNTGFLNQVVKEMFARLDIEAEVIVYQASARALQNANEGIDDGASLRVAGLERKFPNLVRVPEVLIENDFVAYSLGKTLDTKDWSTLAPYEISYILGWQIFQNNLRDHTHTLRAKDAEQMFALLKNDRTEFILYERWQGLWRAKALGLDVTTHEPPLASREMFIYLHSKHAHLVEPAAAALRAMKADGSYQAIVARTLLPLTR